MKKLAIAALSLGLFSAGAMLHAADTQTIKGVLIDQKCGKGKDEAKAAGHPKDCVIKCSKSTGLQVVSGEKVYKLDDAGKKKADEYLAKDDSTTKVEVTGTVDGDTLKVDSIKAQ
jgi:hypothetical protein